MPRAPKFETVTSRQAQAALDELEQTDHIQYLEDHPSAMLKCQTHYCADPICRALDDLRQALKTRAQEGI